MRVWKEERCRWPMIGIGPRLPDYGPARRIETTLYFGLFLRRHRRQGAGRNHRVRHAVDNLFIRRDDRLASTRHPEWAAPRLSSPLTK